MPEALALSYTHPFSTQSPYTQSYHRAWIFFVSNLRARRKSTSSNCYSSTYIVGKSEMDTFYNHLEVIRNENLLNSATNAEIHHILTSRKWCLFNTSVVPGFYIASDIRLRARIPSFKLRKNYYHRPRKRNKSCTIRIFSIKSSPHTNGR